MDKNGKQYVFHCQQEGNLYPLGLGVAYLTNTSNVTFAFFATTKAPTLQSISWHHRLGHLHLHAIKTNEKFSNGDRD
jgi:hypothetical protein